MLLYFVSEFTNKLLLLMRTLKKSQDQVRRYRDARTRASYIEIQFTSGSITRSIYERRALSRDDRDERLIENLMSCPARGPARRDSYFFLTAHPRHELRLIYSSRRKNWGDFKSSLHFTNNDLTPH